MITCSPNSSRDKPGTLKSPCSFGESIVVSTNLKKITVVKLDHETPIFGDENQKCLKSTNQFVVLITFRNGVQSFSHKSNCDHKQNNENIHPHNFPHPPNMRLSVQGTSGGKGSGQMVGIQRKP